MHGFNSDPYEIPGIAPDATQREVKHAYRGLAMKFHPDFLTAKLLLGLWVARSIKTS